MDTLLIFFLNRVFLDIVEKNQKPVFLSYRVPPISVYNLKWRATFQIYQLHIRDSDWLNFIHFSVLETLEWITFNPNYLILISTMETYHFSP